MNQLSKSLLLTLSLLSTDLLASKDVILQLDTQGHTSIIKDIIVTKDKSIITASEDKTVRILDSKTGKEKRKILATIGTGNEGKIFAMALSPDEKYLATGGYNDKDDIRIHSYATGKLLNVLRSHSNVTYDLAFSSDGKYLISGAGDETAKIWNVSNDFALHDTIKFHSDDIYGVKIIEKYGDYFAVTAAHDNKVAMYDMQAKTTIASHNLGYKLKYLAINDQLQHIAVAGKGREIHIYDFDLDLVKKISSDTKPSGLAYSKDGKLLISGTGGEPYIVYAYEAEQQYKVKASYRSHTNLTMAVAALDSQTVISAGGDYKEIAIWDVNTSKIKKRIVGAGSAIWSVGISGNEIAWGKTWTKSRGKSKFEHSINLKDYSISDVKDKNSNFNRIEEANGKYSLSHSAGGEYGYADAILNINKNGNVISSVTKNATDGYLNRCYGWYKDYVISGSANGFLMVYDKNGKEVASLIGHTGEVWSIAVDGDRLVSGSDDQTIRVWNLKGLGVDKTIYPMLSIFTGKDNEWVIWSKSGYFNSSVGGDKYVGYHINQGLEKEARYVGSDKYFDTLFRPDIISTLWKTGSEKKAIAYAGRTKKVKVVDIAQSLPPVVSLLSKSDIKTSAASVEVEFSVQSDENIKEIIVLHNGERINTRGLKKKKNNNAKRVKIDLDAGENIISIKARNKFAMSDEVLVYATKTSSDKNIYKPTLYMLSIGVSKYENPEYNLGVADKDASAMSKMFKAQKGKIYKDVIVKTLLNKNASSDNILDELDWIDREATSKDVVIIFVAGHGVNDDKGTYYFLSHDANMERLRRTAVKWTEIQDTISNLPSKVILLADTCHSGNITGTRRDITSAVKSIINSGSGSVIMTATTGSGYSYEKTEWGHGAFTKSFIDGLGKMKADYDKDGTVTIKEIDLYVTNGVKQLTNGKQKPTTIIPSSVPDFAIGVR